MQQQREIEGNPELLELGRRRRHPAQRVLITHPDYYKLRDLLIRERHRKAIIDVSEIVPAPDGMWAARATRLRPLRPAWVRPALVSGVVVGGLTGLGALGWALVSLAAAIPGATALGAVAVAVLAWRLVSRGSRAGHGPECRVDVTVTHRH